MLGAEIFLAMNRAADIQKLSSLLVSSGYKVVDSALDGASAIRKIRALVPDLVMVDYELPGVNGLDIAKIVEEDHICPAIVIRTADQGPILPGDDQWNFFYIVRPMTRSAIIQTVNLVLVNYRKIRRLEGKIEELKSTLETRKRVERAKGILMETQGLSEKEAFRRIQKQSMDKGVTMREVADSIIMGSEPNS